jgi:hypothetical protein
VSDNNTMLIRQRQIGGGLFLAHVGSDRKLQAHCCQE